MLKIFYNLCYVKCMETIDARKLSTDAQQLLRDQAIRLREAGWKYEKIADTIGVHFTTVCQWYQAYKRGGAKAIKIKKRGRPIGIGRSLNETQEKELQKIIRNKSPDQ